MTEATTTKPKTTAKPPGSDMDTFKKMAPWILSALLGANYGMDALNIASRDSVSAVKEDIVELRHDLNSHTSQLWHSGSAERFIKLEGQQETTTEKVDKMIIQMEKANIGIQDIKTQLIRLSPKGSLELDH